MTMDRLQRGYFRQAAELQYQKRKRQEFQAWFGAVMHKVHPSDYEDIRLTQGDGGLDGIRISDATVFQVYAPREQSEADIASKIEQDFAKAKRTMDQRGVFLQGWVFVHNDEGLTKITGPTLVKLKQQNPNISIECWTFERIWQEIEKLPLEELMEMFGMGPTEENVDRLRFPAIRDVIAYLSRNQAPPQLPISVPDPDKLEHNRLCDEKADMLRVGRRRQGLVEQYLDGMTDPTSGEDIAEAFRDHYTRLHDSGMSANEIFTGLWRYAGGEHFVQPDQFAAVTAVLAYFFAACDIFENVPKKDQ